MPTPSEPTENPACWIRSTVDDRGNAACLLQWGPVQALLHPDTVLVTARDLTTAAAYAETDVALLAALREDIGLNGDHALAHFFQTIRARRPVPTGQPALRIHSVAGARTGRPLVHIARGSMKGELTPDEAREMAQHWTEAATAAQIDVRLRYALGEWDRLTPDEIEHLFALLQKVQR
ncbi:hypothetical protein ACFOOM_07655 [Streptomyces echinoruber]|uniref:Uncharacterized protein n=1 Tax=Streptomyces echinoruber TaxID=68898 RepID=A0A918V8T0_9ACTN|nr:hypothetical protein [Streptomyces echinoruber]GGZ80326.1 hypothetical protein GCM10010389_17690 [Streptomyces echinoruber]